ncbi:NahK/ErcS family hybrid sensor histidine kinase/response regulator [Qipengyuania soli]|uniref:histidine kinase n=1 Tax=Qipengyuania soli TaxID=2782568 RepID=A0A7S8ISD5_9SPHN|nr:NahK/ErcS family hybrid sensor histidine kinase/response regulator [Qipengyuania soli]QPC98043.1 PAS-domain containing protein [Qipengyuania soli]
MPGPAIEEEEDVAALRARIERLEKINNALIDRVERSTDIQGGAFSMFETAITLEAMVRDRTSDLEEAMGQLNVANAKLEAAHHDADAARARLRDAIESLNDGFALFDANDRLLMCNRAFLAFWPELEEVAEDGPNFAELAERLARSGRTIGSLVAPERWVKDRIERHARADGVHVQAMSDGRWVQINELRTSEGGTVGIYTDITSVKAEDARQRAKELAARNLALQSTLDTLSEGACLFDENRKLQAWNGGLADMLKLDKGVQSIIGTHEELAAYCIDERGLDRPQAVEWRDGRSPRISTECMMGDRNFVVRSVTLATGGMAFAFDDVTDRIRFQRSLTETAEMLERAVEQRTAELVDVNRELVEAKNEAERANKSKTSFIAAASHDLLQPLNAARLFVSALGDQRLPGEAKRLTGQASVALDSVEELLEALFEISKLDAGAVAPDIESLDLGKTFTALRIEHGPAAEAKGLVFNVEPTDQWAMSDQRMLRRILQNLVSNAIRYTEEGTVSLSVTEDGDEVRIQVRDTGPGIPPEKREAIFEEFRRLRSTSKQPGHGLGLAIVRRYSATLGHAIEIDSEAGDGAQFTVIVPKGERSPVPADARPQRRSRSPASAGAALLIDNDPAILDGMEALLSGWGLNVVAATSHEDPLVQAAALANPAVLIADYHLDDGMTGNAAITDLRKAANVDLPALVITADRSDEVKNELSDLGVQVLTKPVKPAQLRALLRQLGVLR